uniref:Transposase (Putative), gypsy type n=1 Tax=Tanacetum cinerariifolium TaxID=118510 RepID=A0A6L2NE05_TANCI|nr:hypothetical protein [Tanacetum cinerariifolium]
MSAITDVGCVLTQEALDSFCNTFHISKKVHLVLPNQDDTMHERPVGKIRLYTIFFDFANFKLPLSTFLVDILSHFRINISQLSVIGAAKISHFEILCRVYGINNRFFWVDDFAFPASFLWHTAKHVTRDHALVAADFNAQDYATLVTHPSPWVPYVRFVLRVLWLCCVASNHSFVSYIMDLFAFIHAPDPTKVRFVKRERDVDKPRLLDTIVGRIVPLLLVTPDRADSELEASAVVKAANIVTEDAAPVRLRSQWKRKSVAVDAGGASHLPKKLREDHGASSGTSVSASVSITLEREDEDHTDFVAEPNLRTIEAPQRFVTSSDSSYHSGPTIVDAEVDSLVRSSTPVMTTATTVTSMVDSTLVAKEKPVKPSLFAADSSSAAARQMSLGAEVRMRVKYNVKERRRLKSVVEKKDELLKARDGEIENIKAQLLLKEAKAAKAIRLRAHTSNLEAVEKSLWDEVNSFKGRDVILKKERDALDVKVTDLEASVMKIVNEKFDKLYTDFVEMSLHLEEKFYPHLLTTISGRRWLLTHGMELAIVKCLNSPKYLSALGTAIGKAIEKGMQDGLAFGITHGKKGRVLTNVSAYNPSEEADYISALQQLQNLNFPLLAELKSNTDSSVEAIMEILHLENSLAEKLGLNE